MAGRQAGKRQKRAWLKWAAGAVLFAIILLGVAISTAIHRAEPMLRAAIVDELEEHFHARVELDSFHVSLVGGLRAEGKGLRIWSPADVAGLTVAGPYGAIVTKPLIRLDDFRFHAPLRFKPGEPIRIAEVQLAGLDIDVPPKPHFSHHAAQESASKPENGHHQLLSFLIDRISCVNAHLTIETSKPGKLPLEFDIAQVKLRNVSMGGLMQFDAQLTNPRPAGLIITSGNIGPWQVEDPGETPITGNYNFEKADLGVFKGIAGILNSTGRYDGVLRNLTVDGQANVPEFRLTRFGTALPLETQFHAIVDGTNGDTWLQPVHAKLGGSHFVTDGKIVGVPPEILPNGNTKPGGHEIALNVNVDGGRMEDFLRLTSRSGKPIMTGTLNLKTTLEIPPGTAPMDEKMKLNGNFVLEDAAFTSEKIQHDVGELSMRGQGQPKEAKDAGDEVRSAIESNFTMAGGVITLPNLKYTVPGAEIDLAGKYGLEGSTLNFKGTARTDATISKMVGGWKGVLLKPADGLFKKNGAGTEVPIHVDGTEQNPMFGVDFKKIGHTSPQIPGQPAGQTE
jgi:AsmA-like protein